MKLTTFGFALVFLLSLSNAANAGRVTTNSSYGQIGLSIDTACADCTILNTLGATITGENYDSTSQSGVVVYDFDVSNLMGAYTFDITAEGASILAIDPGGSQGYGVFTCSPPDSFTMGGTPQCSPDVPAGFNPGDTDYGSLNSNVASFPVSGASSTDSFVFFVALDGPPTGVTASFETSAVPEPRLLSLLGIVLVAGFILFRRRRVAPCSK